MISFKLAKLEIALNGDNKGAEIFAFRLRRR